MAHWMPCFCTTYASFSPFMWTREIPPSVLASMSSKSRYTPYVDMWVCVCPVYMYQYIVARWFGCIKIKRVLILNGEDLHLTKSIINLWVERLTYSGSDFPRHFLKITVIM